MLYAIFCYDHQDAVGAWPKEIEDATMARLGAVQTELAAKGRMGPVARLVPTAKAKTVRKGHEAVVRDGPFAETKEQLLGFFIVDCASEEEAIETARSLARANSDSSGSYEVRPLAVWLPGTPFNHV